MDYLATIDTELNTTADSPKSTTIKLTAGYLLGGFLYFPSGPAGKLHCVVKHGLHQILPVNNGENYALDDAVVKLHFGYMIDVPPYQLEVLTWNESVTYSHTLTICIALDPLVKQTRKRKGVNLLSRIFGGNS